MPAQLKVAIGADRDWPVQCWLDGAIAPASFGPSDTVTAYVYRGQSQAQLFALTAAPYTAGAGLGYPGGQVQLTIAAANSATLDADGTYDVLVWWQPSGSGLNRCVWRGQLLAEAAAGTATQVVTPYCTYAEMLKYAPWVALINDSSADQEGFYVQRLEARNWLNDLIVRSWRGTSAAYFGDAARSAQFWLGSWVRRTPLRSYWLMNQLAGGFVLNATIAAPGSGYTSEPVVTAPSPPAGTGNLTATLSALLNGSGGVGSIAVNTQGLGYAPGQALTLSFSGGGGSGAAATAYVSTGVLMLRPDIVRLCAYKAISYVGLAQIGINNQYAGYGRYFGDQAEALVCATVAECDLNGDGIADLPIPLVATNTLFT